MQLISEIYKIFPEIVKFFSTEEFEEFIEAEYYMLTYYHFGLGTSIRNSFLSPDNELYNLFIESGFKLQDDMSDIIIRLFYIYVKANYRNSL